MNCPACAAELEELQIGGVRLQHCKGCRGTLLAKSDVRVLSKADISAQAALRVETEELVVRAPKVLRCPSCGKPMLSYAFGGGNTRAEGCEACERAFFDGGELAHALEEMRSGIKMSEDTRTLLHGHKVMSAWDRMSRAELGMIAALTAALGTFVVLIRRGRMSLLIAGAIAFGLYIIYRWRAERSRIAAAKQLEQLVGDESARQEASARAAAPAGPWAPQGVARVAPSKPTRVCPFCSAALPAGSTHCNACDSDFG